VFVYETFLYIITALLRGQKYEVLHEVFQTHYLLPETERYDRTFARFDAFQGDTSGLREALAAEGGARFVSPAAEMLKRQATRKDTALNAIIESEMLVFLATLVDGYLSWFPGCLLYAEHGHPPNLFLRAARRSDFEKLRRILGVDSADDLRRIVGEHWQRHERRFSDLTFFRFPNSLLAMMNLESLGTLR